MNGLFQEQYQELKALEEKEHRDGLTISEKMRFDSLRANLYPAIRSLGILRQFGWQPCEGCGGLFPNEQSFLNHLNGAKKV